MILLYGAGGGPGRGEIPMDPMRYRASDAFLFCTWGFEEKLSAATKAQRQTGIGRALRFGGSYTGFKSDPKGGKTYILLINQNILKTIIYIRIILCLFFLI